MIKTSLKHETLILGDQDILKLVGMPEAVKAMEKLFLEDGQSGTKNFTHNFASFSNTYSAKFGALKSESLSVVKSFGLVVLSHDSRPRQPLAIFSEAPITYLRTGAAGAVAARLLGPETLKKVCILGSGRQARAHLEGLLVQFPNLSSVHVWSPTTAHCEMFALEMNTRLGTSLVHACSEKSAALDGAELVVTVTRSREPILQWADLSPGVHVNAFGADAPGAQELSVDLLTRASVFADNIEQAKWMGASNVAFSQMGEKGFHFSGTLGEIAAQKIIPRKNSAHEITVFDCSGLGMMDLAFALCIFERARETGSFLRVDFKA